MQNIFEKVWLRSKDYDRFQFPLITRNVNLFCFTILLQQLQKEMSSHNIYLPKVGLTVVIFPVFPYLPAKMNVNIK